VVKYESRHDANITNGMSKSPLAAPQAPPTQAQTPFLPPLQAQVPLPPTGPITWARAKQLNYIMLLKNKGPKEYNWPNRRSKCGHPRANMNSTHGTVAWYYSRASVNST
jgi:hypothetical protein